MLKVACPGPLAPQASSTDEDSELGDALEHGAFPVVSRFPLLWPNIPKCSSQILGRGYDEVTVHISPD